MSTFGKIVMALAVVALPLSGAQANLLLNGDFETVSDILDTNGAPTGAVTADHWEAWNWGNGWSNTEIADWGSPGGTYHTAVGAAGGGGGGHFQIVPAVADLEYELTVDSGADDWWLPTGTMIMFFQDNTGSNLLEVARNTVDPAVYGENYDIPHPWETYSLSGISPPGTTHVKVELTANNATGSVGFDNVVLIPEPATFAILGVGAAVLLGVRRKKR